MTSGSASDPQAYRFGVFELNLEAGELRKGGIRIKLQEQPFQVLALLLEHPGEIVTREEIVKQLWPDGTFVEFDRSLNIAVNKIREALGDSASHPRFVETVPRRGYRFVAPVEVVGAVPLTTEPEVASPPANSRPTAPWTWFVAIALLVIVGYGIWSTLQGDEVAGPASPTRLTSYAGNESYPSFSPNGDEIAFSWNGATLDNYDIYRKQIGVGEELLRLTTDPARDYSPAWSPDNRWIAFVRESDEGSELAVVSALGKTERIVAKIDVAQWGIGPILSNLLAWTNDANWVIAPDLDPKSNQRGLFAFPIDGGEPRRLTSGHSVGPAVSPDGRLLAFCRIRGYGLSDLCVLPLSADLETDAEPRLLADEVRVAASPTWNPQGDAIIFVGSRQGVHSLWRVRAFGSHEAERLAVGEEASFPAVAQSGNRLAYVRQISGQDIWRIRLEGPDKIPLPPERFTPISSTQREYWPIFSPDGQRIAFHSSRSGLDQVWTYNSKGASLQQMTFIEQGVASSPRWSPDGRQIAFDSNVNEDWEVYVVNSEGGKSRFLTRGTVPSWSRDGHWIYFSTFSQGRSAEPVQIWKTTPDGRDRVQVTKNGGAANQESPDGEWLYFLNDGELWRMPPDGGSESLVVESVQGRCFAPVNDGVYYVPRSETGDYYVHFHDVDRRETRRVASLGTNLYLGFTISPDERTILYVRRFEPESDLMLVENYR
jgi:Tol biopolymer transport system component/DNA-binding winged helix-turn-helix (wHTH) protein